MVVKTLVRPMEKDEQNLDVYLPICKAFRPLLFTMTVLGLYHDKIRNISESEDNGEEGEITSTQEARAKCRITKFYHLFVVVVLVINAIRYIPAFWIGTNFVPDLTSTRVIVCAWLLQCAITGVIVYIICEHDSHLPAFVNIYNQMMTDSMAKEMKLNPMCNKLQLYSKWSMIIGISLILGNTTGIFIISFTEETASFRASVVNPLDYNDVIISVLIIFTFLFESAVWLLPIFFFICTSSTLSLQFHSVHCKFGQLVKDESKADNPTSLVNCLSVIRRKHHQLCQAVEVLDGGFKYIIMNYFAINIFIMMFIMYQLITAAVLGTLTLVIYIFWVVCEVSIILVITIYSTNLTYWAHAPLDQVYSLDVRKIPHSQLGDLNLFVSRLTASPVGFTVMGFFTVTKELILTLAGIFLTYFFLLLQFKI